MSCQLTNLEARNLLVNRSNSMNLKKIDKLDHYIWWMTSRKFINALIKNDRFQMFIKNDFSSFKGLTICINGFVISSSKISGLDVIWSLNKNMKYLNNINKNMVILSIVKKSNKFANLHTKYLGLKSYEYNIKKVNDFLQTKLVVKKN